MSEASSFPGLKRLLVGKPIPSHLAHHERLSRVTGLAVLSSDALSSVAYATDFIVVTLIVAGTQALGYAIPISLVITALLAVVAFSYRQTIHAYPTGGGAYIVAKENIGPMAGLIAAASLLVDYTLTVSVSISAGVLAITSAAPHLDPYRVELCLFFLALLTVGNLRGLKESGRIFAVPTYFFVVSIFALIAVGLYHYASGAIVPLGRSPGADRRPVPLTTFLLLTAFANGCTAMTGVEAVSERRPGVPAARGEERRRDARDDGRAGDRDVPRHHVPRARLPRDPDRDRVRRVAARARDLRQRLHLLPGAGRHHAHPGARGEHRLRRLPAPGVHRVARPVPPAPVHEPGRSPRVLERHPRAVGASPRCSSSRSAATRSRCCRST